MLLIFLYHRVNKEKYSTSKEMLEKQFTYLAKNFKIILPGEKIDLFKINICLTFDDAYFDFYYYIFPLLKKLQIKAQLAVPTKYIQNKCDLSTEERLNVPYNKTMLSPIYLKKVPFCTWEELKHMSDSGLVSIASHSNSHKNLLEKDTDLALEIIQSKKILEEKLNKEVNSFVYPFGKFNKQLHKYVKKYYKYVMRIGSTFNLSWQNINNITYRIPSDSIKNEQANLKPFNFMSYLWVYFFNTFRGR